MSTSGPSAETLAACASRRSRLREATPGAGIDALLVSNPKDIRYLTGFVGDDSLLVVTADEAAIISDPRYEEFLEPWRDVSGTEVLLGIRHRLQESVKSHCARRGIRRLGVQAEHLAVADRQRLAAILGPEGVVDTVGLVGQLRLTKDELEVAAIERAIAVGEAALDAALAQLRPGMTELELAASLEYEMKVRGASRPSFDSIVAAGPNSSIIHHLTGRAVIEAGTLLVDSGAVVDGYCSDLTRTFGLGGLPGPFREIYPIVLDAQRAAIDACRPGPTCAQIDAAARRLIEAAGYGAQFGHGLGHGVGLDIHEGPYFNELATDVVLGPGMVMTVEPGIYLPGVGGVRIEDMVLITPDGCRVLTSYPRDPDAAVLEPQGAGRRGRRAAADELAPGASR